MTRQISGLMVALLVSACAFTPHEVEISATAPKSESTIGAGVTVALQVIDDRESTVVGQRGAGMLDADITVKDILSVLNTELTEGLKANGFKVGVPGSTADAEIEVRLRALKFFIESGFFTGAENTSVVLAVEAEKRGQDFDRTYRSSSEKRTIFIPGGGSIDAKLNAALTDVLGRIVRDRKLLDFLAG
ncbi:MAG: YajG family lipoprotein [Defluviicoccus sp.]|nr:YajG family lipoprotein [Defluviicoccus sp.]MDE0384516.1 YajG family lipoprotein [Defluviicoccus sp.]